MQRAACAWWFVLALPAWACENYDPGGNSGLFEACCKGAGTCVPAALVETAADAMAGRLVRGGCARDLLCAPSELVNSTAGLASCQATSGGEGRCLPSCLPSVAEQADQLDRASCATGKLCVPCNDPLSGDDTGVCRIGMDEPHEAPLVFAWCCGGLGRCIPRDLAQSRATPEDVARPGPDSCGDGDQALCVPKFVLDDVRAPSCRALGDLEGRCLPGCLLESEARAGQLSRGECDQGELCSPCYDPLSGDDTGACRIGEDAPKERPRRFADCCQERGRCVPRVLIAASQDPAQIARLGADSCSPDEQTLCVPATWLGESLMADNLHFTPCRGPGQSEGRCVSTCLPQVAQQAGLLERESCADGELCLPCNSPLTGEDTGICRVGDDAPQDPATTFASCCDERGRCVPRELLESMQPADSVAYLGEDSCAGANGSDALCVPQDWLDGALTSQSGPALQSCHVLGRFEGRCLSTCVPKFAVQASFLARESCSEGDLCAPCFDPRNGEDTQLCHLGGDAPREPPAQFEPCCGQDDSSLGACVPTSLLPAERADALPADACSDSSTRCVPRSLVRDPEAPLPSCSTNGGLLIEPEPGVCLPSCFLNSATRVLTGQGSCPASDVCIPCSQAGDLLPGCP